MCDRVCVTIATVEPLTTEELALKPVAYVAGDRCFPLTHSDVSQRTATPAAGEGEVLMRVERKL